MLDKIDLLLTPTRAMGRFLEAIFTISPAKKQFISKAWKSQQNIPWDFLHAYFYARWPYKYIALANSDHGIIHLVKKFTSVLNKLLPNMILSKPVELVAGKATGTTADYYHGKVVPVEDAQNLLMINEPVRVPDLEQVIPYHRARALILENPDHILQIKCPCRMAKKITLPTTGCLPDSG